MTEERKTIKDLTDLDLKDLVDRLIPECQGKVQDIRRDGIPLTIPSSMPPSELFRFLIYTWLLDRQAKGELVKALDIVQMQMWDGPVGFKLHADEELVKDLVRVGFVFDAQLGLFLCPIPMTKEHPLPDRVWVDSDPAVAAKWFNMEPPKDTAEQAKLLRQADEVTGGRFGKGFGTEPEKKPQPSTRFSAERTCFGHGEFGFIIKVTTDKLSGYDNMDETKVQKVVAELNAEQEKLLAIPAVGDVWWQEFMRRVDAAIQEEGPLRDAVIEHVAELVATLPKE